MTNTEFKAYYPRYESVIEAIARKYAGPDADLFEDLRQEGAIGLFDADLSKPYKNEDAFLRNVIRNKIVDHLRWLDPERFDRLDTHLARGAQLTKDADSGQISLVTPDARSDRRYNERARSVCGAVSVARLDEDDNG